MGIFYFLLNTGSYITTHYEESKSYLSQNISWFIWDKGKTAFSESKFGIAGPTPGDVSLKVCWYPSVVQDGEPHC